MQDQKNLPPGTFVVGSGLYARCQGCGHIVKLNKWLLGSLHVCAHPSRRQ